MSKEIFCLLGLVLFLMGACASTPGSGKAVIKEKETLVVYPDGTMQLNERGMNEEDVVIYPDGRGGERAAVKVRVPLHPDFYRDTIVVERKTLIGEE